MSPASQVLAQECFYPKANGPHISKQSIKDDRFSGLLNLKQQFVSLIQPDKLEPDHFYFHSFFSPVCTYLSIWRDLFKDV
jgi:hypothetical protein